ncbi:MAG: acetate/propionate family kinase [Sneathiella sp.]|nr:acetate/propionate family kinase [Sneathiella sp.]
MSYYLTLNAGSSSLKFALYEAGNLDNRAFYGQVEAIGLTPRLVVHKGDEVKVLPVEAANSSEALHAIFDHIAGAIPKNEIKAVGHRIVHGGVSFDKPTVLSGSVLKALDALSPLAPLHQPHNLAAVEAAISEFPDAVQIGCFDTAFHRGHPWVNDTFALPRRFYDAGVRRYGFHGLSYEYLTRAFTEKVPELARGRLIVAHLGSGASLCAIKDGQSIGSTMGFSALDGLPMGTRCGQIDPGVLLYLMEHDAMTAAEISTLLYKESGLKGLSGISSDMRALEQSDDPHATEAIDYYVFRVQREIGAMAAVLGGVDAIVFSGGVGENSPYIRDRILDNLGFLGLSVDPVKNKSAEFEISGSSGQGRTFVLPTNEEIVIARAVEGLV